MASMAVRTSIALIFLAPLLALSAASMAPHDVASALCQHDSQRDEHLLELMQLQAKPKQFMQMKLRDEINIPTLAEVEDAFKALMQELSRVGKNMNITLTQALSDSESAARRVCDYMEVAETSAETAASILGQTGTNILDKLAEVAAGIEDQLQKLVTESEAFREQMNDTLYNIYYVLTGEANGTIGKMETASADVEAAGNSSTASLMQLKTTVAGLQKKVQGGCLSKADTAAFLQMHGRDSLVEHFEEVDSDGDGCIHAEELKRTARHVAAPFSDGDAVAMLMFRAVAERQLSSAALETALARKGGTKDPCSVATSALESANSSLISLEDKLDAVNETMVDLMEQSLELLGSTLQVVNSTVILGLEAAVDAGLPRRMVDPVENGLDTMMQGYNAASQSVKDNEAVVSDAVVNAVGDFTPVLVGYIDGVASKLALVCG